MKGGKACKCRELPVTAYGGIYFLGFCGGLKPEGFVKHGAAAVIDFDDLCFLAEFMVADHKLLVKLLGKVVYPYPVSGNTPPRGRSGLTAAGICRGPSCNREISRAGALSGK